MQTPPLVIRSATSADKAPVLAFCAHTWNGGDYIADVWDAWLSDHAGALLVGTLDDQPVALAHVAAHGGEGWFEGLRIAPDLRGRGFGRQMLRASIELAQQRGATVLRLLTNRSNTAMLGLLPQLGFGHCFDATWYSAAATDSPAPQPHTDDADTLLAQAGDGPWLTAMSGLYAAGWQFRRLTPDQIRAHVAREQVWRVPGAGWAIVMPDGESDAPAIALAAGDLPRVLTALRSHPAAQQHGAIRAFVPITSDVARQAQAVGYTPWTHRFGIYTRDLSDAD